MSYPFKVGWLTAIIFSVFHSAGAQKMTREQYIEQYKEMAVNEMHRSGIPASITLAQGLLESNNGNSRLATKANNHFGIKCHGWSGHKIYHDDDKKDECFRRYRSVAESYEDHTNFLMNSPRYDFLFEYDQTDYISWAKGLKKAGYATAPKYADMLIDLIEEAGLHQYDIKQRRKKDKEQDKIDIDDFQVELGRKILTRNRINYVLARQGDTYKSLTDELDMMPYELAKYNEMPRDAVLNKGQVIYLQPKRNKASVEFKTHRVEEGENMYKISQMYGIKLRNLYQMNLMEAGTQPAVGKELKLR
jgi:LysM repeat protein